MQARSRKGLAIAGIGGAAIIALGAVAWPYFGAGREPGSASHRLRPDDRAVTALGQQVYATHCLACHGAKLEGQANWRDRGADGKLPAPPHDASGHTWHHPDDVLIRITKLGVARAANLQNYPSAMPAYEGVLTDQEIVAVLSWIKAQWPPDIRSRHDSLNRAAARH